MGELTASLAHKLNQPLGAILNIAKAARRLLTAETLDLIEVDAVLDDIIRDDARVVEIVQSVGAMFQRGETKVAPVDLRQLILKVARIANSDARMKGISWSLDLPDSLSPVRGDKTHLTQAVLNLVVNAFDSVGDSEGPRQVVLRAKQEETNQVHVSVRDSGQGIDARWSRICSRLFTRPNRAAWAWGSPSFVQSSRITEAGSGRHGVLSVQRRGADRIGQQPKSWIGPLSNCAV